MKETSKKGNRLSVQDRLIERRMAEAVAGPPMFAQPLAQQDPAAVLAWVKIHTSNAHDMRMAISEVERFDGELGDLAHFIKAGDRIHGAIAQRETSGWLDAGDVPDLKAALVNRISRRVLNIIQCDEGTPWITVKGRLKKAFGGGRWAPEEDILRMFRERKGHGQSAGNFAAKLLSWYSKVADKLCEQISVEAGRQRMEFLETILKVQLKKETAKSIDADKPFVEIAQGMMEDDERVEEEEVFDRREEWKTVQPRRPRRTPNERRGWNTYNRQEYTRKDQGRTRVEQRRKRSEPKRCFKCGSSKHLAAQCEKIKCFECGSEGHVARQCPYIRRRNVDKGEPMEINAQVVRRDVQQRESDTNSFSGSDSESCRSTPPKWVTRKRNVEAEQTHRE